MRLTRPWLPLVLALALTGCGTVQAPIAHERGAAASATSARAPLAELRSAAFPLATVDPTAGRQDLAPLRRAIGEARIVGLGEATHGTREFFRMKHRLFAYMVEEMGFTVFAIEGHRYAAEALNRYIQTGAGDPRAILASEITQTWHMEELLDLVAWMRAYNQKRGDRPAIAYAGFDLQQPTAEIEAVVGAIARLDPARSEAAAKAFDMPAMIAAAPAEREARLKQVRAIEAWVGKRIPDVRIRHFASVVSQTAEMFSHVPTPAAEGSIPRYVGARDAGMATNVAWLARHEYPGRKIALWAHNSHVGDFKDYAGMKGADMMGRALKARFGSQYYRLGFSFFHGAATAQPDFGQPFRKTPLPPARAGSVGHLMHQVGLPLFFLDFDRPAAGSALGRWLRQPQPMRTVGYVIPPGSDEGSYLPTTLAAAYDGLIHVDESTPGRFYTLPSQRAAGDDTWLRLLPRLSF